MSSECIERNKGRNRQVTARSAPRPAPSHSESRPSSVKGPAERPSTAVVGDGPRWVKGPPAGVLGRSCFGPGSGGWDHQRAVVCIWQGDAGGGLAERHRGYLFTDIVGSTRRWEEHGEDMAAALARHDVLLSSAIGNAGGTVFKHTGDGVVAVFRSAAAATVPRQPCLLSSTSEASHGGESRSRCGWACTRARRCGAAYRPRLLCAMRTRIFAQQSSHMPNKRPDAASLKA